MTSMTSPVGTAFHENSYLGRPSSRNSSAVLKSDPEHVTRIEDGIFDRRSDVDGPYPDWSWSAFIGFYAVITIAALVLRALC